MADLDYTERTLGDALRETWEAQGIVPKAKPGWPDTSPGWLLPARLKDHLSHFKTADGIVYRSEPYGPLGPDDLVHLCALSMDGWDVTIDPRASTHFPGSTINILIRRRTK